MKLERLLLNKEFLEIVSSNTRDILDFLIKKDMYFTVVANANVIKYIPILPEGVPSSFNNVVAFSIANYTFTTAIITKEGFTFEAAFTQDNILATVKIPFPSICQIIVEDEVIHINPSATFNTDEFDDDEICDFENNIKNSKQVFKRFKNNKERFFK